MRNAPVFVAAVLLHVDIVVQLAVWGAVIVAALHVASRPAQITSKSVPVTHTQRTDSSGSVPRFKPRTCLLRGAARGAWSAERSGRGLCKVDCEMAHTYENMKTTRRSEENFNADVTIFVMRPPPLGQQAPLQVGALFFAVLAHDLLAECVAYCLLSAGWFHNTSDHPVAPTLSSGLCQALCDPPPPAARFLPCRKHFSDWCRDLPRDTFIHSRVESLSAPQGK